MQHLIKPLTNFSQCRNVSIYKMKLPIEWEPVPKLKCIDKRKSGDDLATPAQLDLTKPKLLFDKSELLKSCSPVVQKVFSLRFAKYKELMDYRKSLLLERVKRHKYDTDSLECKIARMTVDVQYNQYLYENQPVDNKKAWRERKRVLKIVQEKRNKLLRLLRNEDYKRFEWLLDQINVKFYIKPNVIEMLTRKKSITALMQEYCENLREEKIRKFREQLENEQIPFLESKYRRLLDISAKEREHGLEDQARETEREAQATLDKLNAFKSRRKTDENVDAHSEKISQRV